MTLTILCFMLLISIYSILSWKRSFEMATVISFLDKEDRFEYVRENDGLVGVFLGITYFALVISLLFTKVWLVGLILLIHIIIYSKVQKSLKFRSKTYSIVSEVFELSMAAFTIFWLTIQ